MFRHILITISLILLSAFGMSAQVSVPVVVLEYNGKEVKTPLGGVEVIVIGAASTVTDAEGRCELRMNTAKAGDKVYTRRIFKSGYEVFNSDVLGNWHIARDGEPFVIVMCSTTKLQQIKDGYSRVIMKNNDRQLENDERVLENNLNKGTITKSEYEQKLKKLYDEYEEKLNNIENYLDKFAHIDLSNLNDDETRIVEMLQHGNIDSAIESYEGLNLLSRYQSIAKDVKNLNRAADLVEKKIEQTRNARDTILQSAINEVRLLQMVGGEKNNKKAEQILLNLALADTTYYVPAFEYAIFADGQNNIADASRFYRIALATCPKSDAERLAKLNMNVGDHFRRIGMYEEALACLDSATVLFEPMMAANPDYYAWYMITTKIYQGVAYRNINNYEMAEKTYLQGLEYVNPLFARDSVSHCSLKSMLHINLGNLYAKEEKFEESLTQYHQAIMVIERRNKDNDNYETRRMMAVMRLNLAYLYGELKQYVEALLSLDQAVTDVELGTENNPDSMVGMVEEILLQRADIYFDMGMGTEAKTIYLEAKERLEKLSENYPHIAEQLLQRAEAGLSR